MRKSVSILLLIVFHFLSPTLKAQQEKDSALTSVATSGDTVHQVKKKHIPRVATIRSAILPGWGQIYNKKYWKLPLVYGALGVTAGVFVYNVKTYRLLRLAYNYASDTIAANDNLIDPKFKNLSAASLKTYRNSFRQNVDYSVLFFIAFWGLNVADATVDAHLKAFDVNDNLSLQLKQGYSPMANTTGLSLVLDIHSKKHESR